MNSWHYIERPQPRSDPCHIDTDMDTHHIFRYFVHLSYLPSRYSIPPEKAGSECLRVRWSNQGPHCITPPCVCWSNSNCLYKPSDLWVTRMWISTSAFCPLLYRYRYWNSKLVWISAMFRLERHVKNLQSETLEGYIDLILGKGTFEI